jgi:hypothetical protein
MCATLSTYGQKKQGSYLKLPHTIEETKVWTSVTTFNLIISPISIFLLVKIGFSHFYLLIH